MKKKFLATVLSMSMVMGMALTANAAPATGTVTTDSSGVYAVTGLEATSTVKLPTIKIDVPTDAVEIIMNPYQIGVTVDGESVTDAVISSPVDIISSSSVPINVNVEASAAKDGGSAIIAAAPLTKDITTKSVFLFMEFGDVDAASYTFSTAYDKSKKNQTIIGPKATTKTGIIQIPAVADTDTDSKTVSYKISGTMVSEPSTAPWAETDKIIVKYKFTFSPAIAAATP